MSTYGVITRNGGNALVAFVAVEVRVGAAVAVVLPNAS
jgi:hypothetical protein